MSIQPEPSIPDEQVMLVQKVRSSNVSNRGADYFNTLQPPRGSTIKIQHILDHEKPKEDLRKEVNPRKQSHSV